MHSQYRAIGVNYNQTVKHINAAFNTNKAASLLKHLEEYTAKLIQISEQIAIVTNKLMEKYGSQN